MPVSIVHETNNDNKGSCSKYIFYLNKENKEYIKDGEPTKQQFFFNQNHNKIKTIQALTSVDDNNKGKGLKKKLDKYFTLTINFSNKELKHLAKTICSKNIKSIDELNPEQYQKYNTLIREYTRIAMKNYADNFNNNINTNDIVWVAKIEHKRRYKGFENEVTKGLAKSGQLKSGLNTHVHITISRMHKQYRTNLSPRTNARNSKKLVLRGKKVESRGFDRSKWKERNENSFDKLFAYQRQADEKFENLRTLKNGSFREKLDLKRKIELEKRATEKERLNNTKQIEL